MNGNRESHVKLGAKATGSVVKAVSRARRRREEVVLFVLLELERVWDGRVLDEVYGEFHGLWRVWFVAFEYGYCLVVVCRVYDAVVEFVT